MIHNLKVVRQTRASLVLIEGPIFFRQKARLVITAGQTGPFDSDHRERRERGTPRHPRFDVGNVVAGRGGGVPGYFPFGYPLVQAELGGVCRLLDFFNVADGPLDSLEEEEGELEEVEHHADHSHREHEHHEHLLLFRTRNVAVHCQQARFSAALYYLWYRPTEQKVL